MAPRSDIVLHHARWSTLPARWDWLDRSGRRRAARFARALDREAFVAAQSFLRQVLARHTGRPPQELRFGRGRNGKPLLRGARGLGFNMAHGGDQVLVAVARGRRVGVDVEPVRPRRHLAAVVRAACGPRASRSIGRKPAFERPGALAEWWVRAEACAKATGRGLTLPVSDDVPAGFRMALVEVGPGLRAALAFDGPPARVRLVEDPER